MSNLTYSYWYIDQTFYSENLRLNIIQWTSKIKYYTVKIEDQTLCNYIYINS